MKLISTDFIGVYFKYIEGFINIKVSNNVNSYIKSILPMDRRWSKPFVLPSQFVSQNIPSIVREIDIYSILDRDCYKNYRRTNNNISSFSSSSLSSSISSVSSISGLTL